MTSEQVEDTTPNAENILVSHLSEFGGGNAIFKDRGINLTTSVVRALEEYEQQGMITVTVDEVINNLSLKKVVTMQRDTENLTPDTRHRLFRYLKNNGPYDEQTPFENLDPELAKQHAFGESYVARAATYLTEATS